VDAGCARQRWSIPAPERAASKTVFRARSSARSMARRSATATGAPKMAAPQTSRR